MKGNALIIVAHPDDELLWAGGTILMNPRVEWTIITLCRASDGDRAPKFHRVLKELNASGTMGDLDDAPEQAPLRDHEVEGLISFLVPKRRYDYLLTHSPLGEYTRHLRHEETGRAVISLWESGLLSSKYLWLFAYDDGHRAHLPLPIPGAHRQVELPEEIWTWKYRIITEIYGFPEDGFEAKTTPRTEAFWCFSGKRELLSWKNRGGLP